MRGVIVVIIALFSVTAAMLVAVTVVDPLSTRITNNDAVEEGPIDADQWSSDLRSALYIWGPLVFLGVNLTWAVAWYHRRERSVRRR